MENADRHRLKTFKIDREKNRRGKSYEADIASKEAGAGIFNVIHKAEVSAEGGTYRRTFMLKEPRVGFTKKELTDDDRRQMMSDVVLLVRKHRMLKDAGIEHIPLTYHVGGVDDAAPVIVMTDYTEDGKNIVLSNNTKHTGGMIHGISNFDELLQNMGSDAARAAEAGVLIPLDAYFFIAPNNAREQDAPLDFAIVDYDMCKGDRIADDQLLRRNRKEAAGAVAEILDNHVPDDSKRMGYKQKIDEWLASIGNKE